MEGEPADTSMDLSNQIPATIEDFSSQSFSESLIEPTLYGVNTHNQLLSGFPLPSMSQMDPPFRDLHSNLSLTHLSHLDDLVHHGRDPFFVDNASNHQLLSQHPLCSSFNNSASSFPQKVADSWQTFPSGGYSQALSSSVETPLHYAYKGQVSDPHEKWNFSKLLNQPEFAWKEATLTSPFCENMDTNRWIQDSGGPPSSEQNNEQLPPPVGLRIQENCPDMSCCDQHPCQGSGGEVCLSSSSNGDSSSRFSQVISQSKYLRVLQEVLSEFSSFSLENMEEVGTGSTSPPPSLLVSGSASDKPAFYSHQHQHQYQLTDQGMTSFMGFTELLSSSLEGSSDVPPAEPLSEAKDGEAQRAQLLGLLQMVDDCYNQCLDEIHTVISAFHAATELDTQIHACFALRTISVCYKSLKERISNQILRMGIDGGGASSSKSQRQNKDSFEKSFLQKQWALHQLRRRDQLWRPQRGLPERSVSVLRAWMFQNFLHPYPKDAEKHLLAIKSGLTRSQVSNWFINARVRLWKPLIEEMYSELNRRKGREGNTRNLSCSSLICNQTFNIN